MLANGTSKRIDGRGMAFIAFPFVMTPQTLYAPLAAEQLRRGAIPCPLAAPVGPRTCRPDAHCRARFQTGSAVTLYPTRSKINAMITASAPFAGSDGCFLDNRRTH